VNVSFSIIVHQSVLKLCIMLHCHLYMCIHVLSGQRDPNHYGRS
jgi:hypothetical protein